MPGRSAAINGYILARLGHHHCVADQSGACVTASVHKKPGFSSCADVQWLLSAPPLQECAGLRCLLDGGTMVPAVWSAWVPAKNYGSHHSPDPAHGGAGFHSHQS